jgi:membrane-associated phospholipid phosphatase
VPSAACACDETLLRFARTRGHDPRAERAVASFSRIGEHAAVWLALGAAGWLLAPARRPAWRRASTGVAATYVLNTLVKLAVRRPRPRLDGLPPLTDTPTALSFPSAHTSTAVAATCLYSRLGVPAFPLLELSAALSYSRIYLGVHYPSDLLGGAALGAAVGLAWRRP